MFLFVAKQTIAYYCGGVNLKYLKRFIRLVRFCGDLKIRKLELFHMRCYHADEEKI